ncbi:hypothetical protein VNI00_003070 [Paramarasmius palmivorus]|uniref:Uncharacterized protein n=1 Tax=Paramarasmius palmivorus TaxID=297713 RepID=A0AAW0DZE0_9AGAR
MSLDLEHLPRYHTIPTKPFLIMRYKFDAEQWSAERCSEVFPAQPSIDRRFDKRQARGVFSHEQECWIRTQEEKIWSPLHESKFDKAQELGVDVATVEKIYKEAMAFQFSIKFEDSLPAGWRDKLNRKWVHNKHQTNVKGTQDTNCAPTAVMLATGDPQIYPYGLFFQSVNEQVRNELEALKRADGEEDVKIDIGEVQREVGEQWWTMADDEKQVWKNKADDEKFDPLDFKRHMSDALSEAFQVEWCSWVAQNLKSNMTTLYREKFRQDQHGQYILHPFEPSWSLDECRQHVRLFVEASWEISSHRSKTLTLPWAGVFENPSEYLVPDILEALACAHIDPQNMVNFASTNMLHVVGFCEVLIKFQNSHPGQSIWLDTEPKPQVSKRDTVDDQGEGIQIEDLAMLPKRPTHLQSPSRSRVLLSPSSSNGHVSPTQLSSSPSSQIPSCEQPLFPTVSTQSTDTNSPYPESDKRTLDIRGPGESAGLSAIVPKVPPPLISALLPDKNVVETTDFSIHSPLEGLSEMVPVGTEFPSPSGGVEANRTSIANDAMVIEDLPSHDFDDPGSVLAEADAVTHIPQSEFPNQVVEQPSTSPRVKQGGKKLGSNQRHAMKIPPAAGTKRAARCQESQPEHKKRKVIPDDVAGSEPNSAPGGVTESGSRRSGRARKPQDRSTDNNITGEAQNKRKR